MFDVEEAAAATSAALKLGFQIWIFDRVCRDLCRVKALLWVRVTDCV